MRAKTIGWGFLLAASLLVGLELGTAQQTKKDYLSDLEADKIRDAESASQRIKLFISFAEDRIKKFQYELGHPSSDRRRAEHLNGLLNAYVGCVDEAANLIELGRDKQEDIRAGIKEMQAKGKEFLAYLEELSKNGPERASYQATLADAIEGTRDALKDAEKAAKEIAPPPVRRKQ
jgi:hypothetical protein